jgi:hypothetical protein
VVGSDVEEHFTLWIYLSWILEMQLDAFRSQCPGLPAVTKENVNIEACGVERKVL